MKIVINAGPIDNLPRKGVDEAQKICALPRKLEKLICSDVCAFTHTCMYISVYLCVYTYRCVFIYIYMNLMCVCVHNIWGLLQFSGDPVTFCGEEL